tara:strand:+ start:158 stop:1096 length:939 start_codon:yes stop_codon:yes gene_type:complete
MPNSKAKSRTAVKIINASAESFTYFLNQLVANRLHLLMNYFFVNFGKGIKATLSFSRDEFTNFCHIKLSKSGKLIIVAINKAFAYLCDNLGITKQHLESTQLIEVNGTGVRDKEFNFDEISTVFANLPTLVDYPRAISRQKPAAYVCPHDENSRSMADQLSENTAPRSSQYQLFAPFDHSTLTANNRLSTGVAVSNSNQYQLLGPCSDSTVTTKNCLPAATLATETATSTLSQHPLTRPGGSVQTTAKTDMSLFSTLMNLDNHSLPATLPSAALPLRDLSSNSRHNSNSNHNFSADRSTATTAFTFGISIDY